MGSYKDYQERKRQRDLERELERENRLKKLHEEAQMKLRKKLDVNVLELHQNHKLSAREEAFFRKVRVLEATLKN